MILALALCLGCMSFATAEEKVKLTAVFISHALTRSVDEMKWISEIEEAAGVDVTWEQVYTDWSQVKYAVIIVSTVPILCVYPFVQKYFEKGVMIGAVKG